MKRIHVFTSAAGNYLPKVRILFQSLRRHRPEWVLHLAVADAPLSVTGSAAGRTAVDADHIHDLHDLGIPHCRPWAFCHSLIELATAIKPFALKKILARPDCAAVIYLDPDIAVFSPLAEVADSFENADILLTPHQTMPEDSIDGIVANEICTALHGIYNLGFIGVAAGATGRAFAAWWSDRTYRFCREDIANGVYTDQRWIDFVPAFFENVKVLRSPALNVAPWNLSTRRLAGGLIEGLTVNGQPLGFYHFSQVDAAVHDALVSTQPLVADLVRWYRSETKARADTAAPAWAFAHFDDGTEILPEQRLIYRLRRDVQLAHPDPFAAGANSYCGWWRRHARDEYPRLFSPPHKAAALSELAAILTYRRVEDEFGPRETVEPLYAAG